jgi:MraZ protein
MFSGEYEHTMDDKGRVFLPTRFRDELGDSVVLWRGVDGQLMVAPTATWQEMADRIGQQNQARRWVRDVGRILYAGTETPVDRQGRVVIPPSLRKYADLELNVVIVGMRDHLEIWGDRHWQEVTERVRREGGTLLEELAEQGLIL